MIPLILAAKEMALAGEQFTSDAQMVVLHATVSDHRGAPISGLAETDFRVFEDGVRQRIRLFKKEDQPVSIGLIVDNSGSMRRKREDVSDAALAFMHASNPSDEMFVVNFNDRVTLGLPATTLFSADLNALRLALSNRTTGGMTSLYDALDMGIERLSKASAAKKVLVLISDGGDNASRHSMRDILQEAESSQAIIYAIGIYDEYDTDKNPKILNKLAKETGGQAFFPSELKSVIPICEKIAADIRNQYTIGYVPENAVLDGAYRTIQVTAQAPHYGKLTVRTRQGYLASANSREGIPLAKPEQP